MTQDQKEYYVNKILQSEIFRGKELYQKLLRYLVESAFKGAVPKEVTVARDVFHKGREFNASEDAVVRVHMHNLRNKLERYYQIEGQSDLLRIHIPKGHYRIEFIAQANTKPALKTPFRDQLVYLLSALVCLLLIFIIADKIVLSGGYVASDISRHNNKFWRYFFDNDYPTFVVIGDFLVFHEYDSRLDRSRRIQDYMINTADELDEYILKHPENWPQPWDLGELPHNSIYNIIDIYPIFRVFNQDIQIRYTSDIDIDFIKNRNIVYIGEFKNLRALSDLMAALPIRYETLPWWHGTLTFPSNDSLVTKRTTRDWTKSRYVTDLGVIAKLPGNNNENYLIFAGFGYDAQIKIVNIVSHKESLLQFENKIREICGRFPEYYCMAFEVKGFDRASTTAELVFFSVLDKKEYLQKLIPTE